MLPLHYCPLFLVHCSTHWPYLLITSIMYTLQLPFSVNQRHRRPSSPLSSIYFPPLGSRGIPRGATRSGQTQHIIRMGMKAATVSVECFRAFSTNQNCCTPFFLRESTIPALLYLLLNLRSIFISYSVSSSAQGATRYRCCKPKSSHHVRGTVLPPPDLHQRSRGTAKPF